MVVQYRIKNIGGNFFPQVRMKRFIGWSKWYKIARHQSGFGLYPESNTSYPKDCYDSETIIKDYHQEERHTVYATLYPNQ